MGETTYATPGEVPGVDADDEARPVGTSIRSLEEALAAANAARAAREHQLGDIHDLLPRQLRAALLSGVVRDRLWDELDAAAHRVAGELVDRRLWLEERARARVEGKTR